MGYVSESFLSVVRTFGTAGCANQRRAGLARGLMLGGEVAVLQAPMPDGVSLDPCALFDDGRWPAELGVGGRHVAQALVITLVVIVDLAGGRGTGGVTIQPAVALHVLAIIS